MQVTALMPIKKESERVLNKNKRSFLGEPLFYYVYRALSASDKVAEIIINTDCDEIRMAFEGEKKVKIIKRPSLICGHDITMNTLIEHDILYASTEHLFQTHCTNPLLSTSTIDCSIDLYFKNIEQYDSLFSVNKIQCRLYEHNLRALNHDPSKMQRTQDMNYIYKENSNFFIFSKKSFIAAGKNRVGLNPNVFEMNNIESVDIDYEDDFTLAELLYENRSRFKHLLK